MVWCFLLFHKKKKYQKKRSHWRSNLNQIIREPAPKFLSENEF